MSKFVDELLEQIGWTSGLHVPVADEENKKLEAELERLIAKRAEATLKLSTVKEKYNTLESHLHHVEREQSEGQALLATQRAQINSEFDQSKNTQCELNRMAQEISQMDKQICEINERHSNIEKSVSRTMGKLEDLKKAVAFDTDTLRLWEDALLRSQEDNELILKFSKEDESKARELELRRQKLREEVTLRKHTVDRLVSEIMALETTLEKSQQLYNGAKLERAQLLNQWREAVAHLRQRHRDIHFINEEFDRLQQAMKNKKEALEEQKTFYQNEINNNKELEETVAEMNRETAKAKNELRLLGELLRSYHDEVNIVKKELAALTNTIQQTRNKHKKVLEDIENKKVRLKQIIATNTELAQKNEKMKNKSMTANERIKELETMLESSESILNLLNSEISRLQGVVYRSQQLLFEMKQQEDQQIIDIREIQMSIDLMYKEYKNIENEIMKQKEVVYNFDFQISQFESKIDKLEAESGEVMSDEKQQKIIELTQNCNEKLEIVNILQAQLKRVEEDMRRTSNYVANDNLQLMKLKDTLQNRILMVEGGKKQVKQTQQCSEQKQVEENVLRLKTAQTKKILENMGNALYTMERHRLEMEAVMKERLLEVNMQKDLLSLKRRNLLEDKGKLRTEIQERLLRVEQFKKRYEIAVSLLGTDDDGTPLTATHYKIKNAQEKYMLQNEGDELDLKIRQAEREIVAMENTLKVVNATNDKFKRSLNPIEDEGPEKTEMLELEKEHYEAINTLRQWRHNKIEKENDIEKASIIVEELKQELGETYEVNSSLQKSDNTLHKYLVSQKERINRTTRQLTKLVTQVRQAGTFYDEERDISIREQQDINEHVLQQLAEFHSRFVELAPTIEKYFKEYSVTLPPPTRYPRQPERFESISSLSASDLSENTSTSGSAKGSHISFQSGGTSISQVSLSFKIQPETRKEVIRRLSTFSGSSRVSKKS